MTFLTLLQESFTSWLWLFGAPIRDTNILWILVPIWVSWFFTEFFQEKRGTGFGNAITNGGVSIWVAIDWSRHLTNSLASGDIATDYTLYVKFALSAFVLVYGIVVIVKGLKRKKFASIGGRIRVITYILVMFTPIIYDTSQINLMNIVSILIYFPVFYFLLEIIERIVPDSKALATDKDSNGGPDPSASGGLDGPFSTKLSEAGQGSIGGSDPTANPFDKPTGTTAEQGQPGVAPSGQAPGQPQPPRQNPFSSPQADPRQSAPNMQPRPNPNSNLNPQMRGQPNPNPQGRGPFQQPQGQQPPQYQEPDFDRLPDKDKVKKNPFSE